MGRDVFISCSERDHAIADRVRADLESSGISCWYAPRDAAPGVDPETASREAIRGARVMVLILTEEANASERVIGEVGTAVGAGVTLVPYILMTGQPGKGMMFYLSTVHWLEAAGLPPEESIPFLRIRVRSILESGDGGEADHSTSAKKDYSRILKWIRPAVPLLAAAAGIILLAAGAFRGTDPGSGGEQATFVPTATPPTAGRLSDVREVMENTGEQIEGLLVIGDEYRFWWSGEEAAAPEDVAERLVSEDGNAVWRRKEDGSEIKRGTADLSFLPGLANLRTLILVAAGVDAWPDLSGLRKLERVEAYDCPLHDLEGLRNSPVTGVILRNVGQPDYTPLETCANLAELDTDILPWPKAAEDLENLSSWMKKRVMGLIIAGDRVYDPAEYDVLPAREERDQAQPATLVPKAGGTAVQIEEDGRMTDLRALEGMDNLTSLTVIRQPLENLEGVQALERLESLSLIGCGRLSGIGEVASLVELRELRLRSCEALESIDGIGGLKKLCCFELYGSEKIDRLDGLAACDLSFSNEREEGFIFGFESRTVKYYNALKKLKRLEFMRVADTDKSVWLKAVAGAAVRTLVLVDIRNQDRLEDLAQQHPEMEEMTLYGCDSLKDLSPLARVPSLRVLRIPRSSRALIRTLDRVSYSFTIELTD